MARSNYCLEISKVRERLKISGPFQSSEILGLFLLAFLRLIITKISRSLLKKKATSSPGLFPQKMGGPPHPFFEGKALGTRLKKKVT